MGFAQLPQPFVCCVLIDDAEPAGVLRTMKLAEYEGADAFDLELAASRPSKLPDWTGCGTWKLHRRSWSRSAARGTLMPVERSGV